jgi:hypothetical protein
MLHLSTDRLAALSDDPPTPAEADHLTICEACARERAAYGTLVSMARAERAQIGPPLTRWEGIAAALAPDAAAAGSTVWPFGRRARRWPMRAAAGLLLMAGGAMLGRASAGAGILPSGSTVPGATGPARVQAALAGAAPDSTAFASVDEARAAQHASELRYQQAAAYLAQFDSAGAEGDPVAYRSRLAALDQVISTTREAMREAPHDPVINGYYLTTLGQREATLRQMNTALPASLRLNSF